MLDKVLKFINPYSNRTIVATKEIINSLNKNENYIYEIVEDVRSATFFSFGNSKSTFSPSVMIVDEMDLPNTYTGLTEAYYQRIPIFVVVICNKNNERIKSEFLEFSSEKQYIISDDLEYYRFERKFIKLMQSGLFGPIILKVNNYIDIKKAKLDFSILSYLNEFLYEKDLVILSDVYYEDNIETKFKKYVEKNNYKYGIVSKYCGYIQNTNDNIILICSSENIYLDINIFNNRYINNKLKIIVFKKEGFELNIQSWIESNKIRYKEYKTLNKELIREFIESKDSMLVYIN